MSIIESAQQPIGEYLDLPPSHSMGWFLCDHCDNLHIVLKDKDGEAFATATLDEEMLIDMLATIRGQAQQ